VLVDAFLRALDLNMPDSFRDVAFSDKKASTSA